MSTKNEQQRTERQYYEELFGRGEIGESPSLSDRKNLLHNFLQKAARKATELAKPILDFTDPARDHHMD